MFGRKPKNQRRNLTDQTSKRVYSYYSNTRLRDEQPERSRQTEPKRKPSSTNWFHHLPTLLTTIVLLGCGGYILSINDNPKIVELTGSQNIFLHSKDDYQQAAQKIVSDSWLNYNKVTINSSHISQELKRQFPELSDVSVTVPLINRRPIVYIASSKPTLLLMGVDNSMVVDARGVAILPATEVKNLGHYKLLTVKDDSGLSPATGQSAMPTTDVKFISSTYDQLKAAGESIDQFILPAKPNELDVKLSGHPYLIKMDITGDSREQVGAYVASKTKITSLKDDPKQYIDVRVTGRVYYQ